MRTPFDAEQPNLTWEDIWEGVVFTGVSHTPVPRGRSPELPILGPHCITPIAARLVSKDFLDFTESECGEGTRRPIGTYYVLHAFWCSAFTSYRAHILSGIHCLKHAMQYIRGA